MPEHVLMTADAVGGVWTYALELSQTLVDRGVEVTLAVMGPPPTAAQRASAPPGVAILERPYRLEWMDKAWADVDAAGEWLLGVERTLKPDLIHLNGYAHAVLDWRAPTVVVAHSCVVSWWRAVHGTDPPPEWRRYRECVAAGLQAADLLVTPTFAMLQALQDCYGALRRTVVIPNGRSVPHRHLALHDAGTSPARQAVVLTAGRVWDVGKNVEAVCAAARGLRWPVYVAGDARRAESMTDAPNVCFLGRLTPGEVWAEMERAAIYALPALYEPFGLSVLEAGLAGCALVLGDIPSLREVWGDAAVFVPPADVGALTAALGRLIDDDSLRAELGGRARRRAALFTSERMADLYCDAYRSLLPLAAV